MTGAGGWAFLIPFAVLAALLIGYMLMNPSERDQAFKRGANVAPLTPVKTPPELNIPKPHVVDPLYDWDHEGDFPKDVLTAQPISKAAECELGCAWVFVGRTQEDAENLRQDHYEEEHGHDVFDVFDGPKCPSCGDDPDVDCGCKGA